MRWLRRSLVAVATGVFYGVLATSVAGAVFGASDSDAITVSSQRIFADTQSTSAWVVQDASAGGTSTSATDVWSAVDGRVFTTANVTNAFNSTRYVELALSNPLANSIPVSTVSLNLTLAQNGGGNACVYVEVRRASTNALLGTHGSSSSPLSCNSSTTQTTTTTNLTYLTSSTAANDLKVKVFLRNSSSRRIAFDRVTVTGTAYSTPFTLYEKSAVNSSSGTAATTPWAFAANDSTTYAAVGAWAASFNSSRYLDVRFPAIVPEGASVGEVTLIHSYANATGITESCVYVEVYDGAALLASHGSPSQPYSCNSSATQMTDTIGLPEVDTERRAEDLLVRIYVRSAGSVVTRHGLLTLTVEYELT